MKEKTKSDFMSGASVAAGAGLGVVGGAAVAAEMNAANTPSSEAYVENGENPVDESFREPELSTGHLEDHGGHSSYEPFQESNPTPSPADIEADEVTVVQSESAPMPFPENEESSSSAAQNMVGGTGNAVSSENDFHNEYDLTGNPSGENGNAQTVVNDDDPIGSPDFSDGVNPEDPNADDVEIKLSDPDPDDLEVFAAETPGDPNADDVEITLSEEDHSDFSSEGTKEMFLDGNGEAPMPGDNGQEKGVYDFGNHYDSDGYGDGGCDGDDGDIQVLGAETIETEDGDMDVVGLSVDGTEAYVVDVDQDGIADAMIVDADGDGEISDDEILDVTEDEMSMSDLTDGGAFESDADDPFADTDIYAQEEVNDGSNSCDYVNDANVDDYLA